MRDAESAEGVKAVIIEPRTGEVELFSLPRDEVEVRK
jgi:hypothetical protein